MKLIELVLGLGLFAVAQLAIAQPAKKTENLRVILHDVQFSAEKTTIRSKAGRELDEVAVLMAEYPTLRLNISAHTDASGSAGYNLRLSQKRATAVRAYLIHKGISSKRLSAYGYGETRPIVRCSKCSAAQKQQNRRVELLVKGLSTDSLVRAPWMALGGQRPPKPVVEPKVPKMSPTSPAQNRRLPEANNSVPLPRPTQKKVDVKGDYFPALSDANSEEYVPAPLPATFVGYTIEVSCSSKPLSAGDPTFRKAQPVYLRNVPIDAYCYYIGTFFTLPEVQEYFKEKVRPDFPAAKIVSFGNVGKRYHYF